MPRPELDPDDIVAAAAKMAQAIEARSDAPYACHHQVLSARVLDAVVSPETSVYLAVLNLRAKVDALVSSRDLQHRGPGFLVLAWAQPTGAVDRVGAEPDARARELESSEFNCADL